MNYPDEYDIVTIKQNNEVLFFVILLFCFSFCLIVLLLRFLFLLFLFLCFIKFWYGIVFRRYCGIWQRLVRFERMGGFYGGV